MQQRGGDSVDGAAASAAIDDQARAAWRKVLLEGHEPLRRAHRIFRHLPRAPRCKLCHNPFGGVGGWLVGLAGFKPSRKNPNLCSRCCDTLPPGGLEVDIAVLMADVRGSTALCQRVGAEAFAGILNGFYRTATAVLIRHDAIVDKLVGDEVVALFVPGIAGPEYRRRAVVAATELIATLSNERPQPGEAPLAVGAAVTAGVAYVGNVGTGQVVDFTALGDPVNAAARLQAHAAPGEVLIASDVYRDAGDPFPQVEHREIDVRGQKLPASVEVVRIGSRASPWSPQAR